MQDADSPGGYSEDDKEALRRAMGLGGKVYRDPQQTELANALRGPAQPSVLSNPNLTAQNAPPADNWIGVGQNAQQAARGGDLPPQYRGVPGFRLQQDLDAQSPPKPTEAPPADQTPKPENVQVAPEPKEGSAAGAEQEPKPVTIPEHWVNTLDPESRKALGLGQSLQLEGTKEQGDVESQGAKELYAQAAADQAAQEKRDAIAAQKYEEAGRKLQTHMGLLQKQGEMLATAKADPEHFMHSKSTLQKIGLAFAQAASTFGSSITHGPNTAVDMIHSAIDDDIKAQEQNIANSKYGLENSKGLLADEMRLFGDMPTAREATRQMELQAAGAHLDQIARKFASPKIEALNKTLQGEIYKGMAASGAQFNKYVPAQTVGGPGAGTMSDITKDDMIKLSDGRWVNIPEKDREMVQKSIAMSNVVHENVQALRRLTAVPLAQRANPNWIAAYDSARENLAKSELDAQGKGGLGIIEKNEEAAGNRHGMIFTPGVEGALKQIEASAAAGAEAKLRGSAQFEVKPQIFINPKTHEQTIRGVPLREFQPRERRERAGSAKGPGES
jgi:hypothetical protein